jgi:hypothetical protein
VSYVHISKSPGVSVAEYERVLDELGPDPIAGQLLHIIGEAGGCLHIVDVWQSKAHADRFVSERLFPAFAQVGIVHSPGQDHVELNGTVVIGSAVTA